MKVIRKDPVNDVLAYSRRYLNKMYVDLNGISWGGKLWCGTQLLASDNISLRQLSNAQNVALDITIAT